MDEATARTLFKRANHANTIFVDVYWEHLADLAQFWLDNYKPTPTTTDWGEKQVNIYAKVEDQNG
jgi:hypothetical protein